MFIVFEDDTNYKAVNSQNINSSILCKDLLSQKKKKKAQLNKIKNQSI